MNKSGRFQVCVTSELLGLFLSNLVCEVVYISCRTYINLVNIAPIVFKLQWAEKVLTGVRVNNTLVRHTAFLAADTLPHVLYNRLIIIGQVLLYPYMYVIHFTVTA